MLNEENEEKLITVYKESGKSLKVNKDMLPYLDELKLSKTKPKKEPKA